MEPAPALYSARDSMPIARPTFSQRDVSNDAPSAIGQGNEVGQPVLLDSETDKHPVAAPWRASPLPIDGVPNRGIAGIDESMALAMSAGLIRLSRSVNREEMDNSGLQYGYEVKGNISQEGVLFPA